MENMNTLIFDLEMLHAESKHNNSLIAMLACAMTNPDSTPEKEVVAEALLSLGNACAATLEKQDDVIKNISELYELSLSAERND